MNDVINDTENTTFKKEDFALPKGLKDIVPSMHEYFTYIKKVVRHRCRQAGFRRISTPIFERYAVFEQGIGKNDRILKKAYRFEDADGNDLALKPEGMTGIIRSYIHHNMQELAQPVELYFIEPIFRFTSNQKDGYSQFHQFGAAVIGDGDASLTAQMIYLGFKVIRDLGLESFYRLQVNNVGCDECRVKYFDDFTSFYFGKERSLCDRCKEDLQSNPMGLIDCNEEDCGILSELAPKIHSYLCRDCKNFHNELKEYLAELSVKFDENPRLVPVLGYYNRSVFEFRGNNRRVNKSGCGGGRMDCIASRFRLQTALPAVGFSMRIEDMVHAMRKEKIRVPSKDNVHVFVAQLGKVAKKKCLTLIDRFREEGVKSVGALGKGSMREQIDLATQFEVPYMVLMGVTEVRDETVIIRDMKKGQQCIVPYDSALLEVKKRLGEKNLDKYSPGEILY